MNIKAERIEQLIQLVNRNLLLIFSGQPDGEPPPNHLPLAHTHADGHCLQA